MQPYTWSGGIVDLTIKEIRADDFNRDGLPDLTVALERAHTTAGPPPAAPSGS